MLGCGHSSRVSVLEFRLTCAPAHPQFGIRLVLTAACPCLPPSCSPSLLYSLPPVLPPSCTPSLYSLPPVLPPPSYTPSSLPPSLLCPQCVANFSRPLKCTQQCPCHLQEMDVMMGAMGGAVGPPPLSCVLLTTCEHSNTKFHDSYKPTSRSW